MKKYCEKCNEEFKSDYKYCPYCGNKLEEKDDTPYWIKNYNYDGSTYGYGRRW